MVNFQYYGLFLDKKAHDTLVDVLVDYHYIGIMNDAKQVYLDHCTLLHNSQLEGNEELKEFLDGIIERGNTSFSVYISAIGLSRKAMAFKVNSAHHMSANKQPHITICTFKGGKPVDSNQITQWYDLDEEVRITVTLKRI